MDGDLILESDDVDAYYDVIASWLDRSLHGRGDIEWWRTRLQKRAAGRVLELGCGTGRVTASFTGDGRQVIGVDRSQAMLERAHARLKGRADVRLIRGDLRALPLRDASIGWVVAPADPLIHLTMDRDRQRAIDEVSRVLLPGGGLLLEFLWWTPADQERARSAEGLTRTSAVLTDDGDTLEVHEHWRESGEDAFVQGTYRFRIGHTVAEASFRGRRWTCDELDQRLRSAKLDIVALRGGFDGRTFEPDTAQALLVEAVSARGA